MPAMPPRLMRLRLVWILAFVAWFAQLCLPVAHAAMEAAPPGAMAAWCGDPASSLEAAAALPAEIRDALAQEAMGPDHLAQCAKLCAVGSTPALLPPVSIAALSLALPSMQVMPRQVATATRRHGLPPPSHGPPLV